MRCNYCGHINPEGATHCESCGYSLEEEKQIVNLNETQRDVGNLSSGRKTVNEFSPHATVRETSPNKNFDLGETKAENKDERAVLDRETVRPVRKKNIKEIGFTLTPLTEEGLIDGDTLNFIGSIQELNRSNLDADNLTISSHNQALIEFKDDHWSLIDQSRLRTTYVQSLRPIELRDGDFILIGDKIYKFGIK